MTRSSLASLLQVSDRGYLRTKKLADGKTSKIRILTLNVGSMTGRGGEIAAVLKEKTIDIAGVKETKWKGSKANMLGDGFKRFYHGETNTSNGVGIILGEKMIDHVLQVNRKSESIMRIQLVNAENKMNIISVYAPQVGCSDGEKLTFWEELDDVLESIPDKEGVVVIADFNGHVGMEIADLERWHGGHSYGIFNDDGRAVLQCARMYDLAICNTFFQKKDEHMITYRCGTRRSTIDYILVRRQGLRFVKYCKVIPGEAAATQHRPLILEMELEKPKKTKKRSRETKNKWWNLKNEEFELKFITQVGETIENNWDGSTYEVVERDIVEIARMELGKSRGGKYVEKETCVVGPTSIRGCESKEGGL